MRTSVPQGALALLLAASVAVAGCATGASAAEGFSIVAPAQPGGAYTFKASDAADNYTWDLGDHLSIAYGRSVSHVYDLKDGGISVILTTRSGSDTKVHSRPLILGSGKNDPATFLLEASTDWAVLGQPVTFSAARSSDPDGDALRLAWSCAREGEAQRIPPHFHALPPPPFATTPPGTVTSGKTNRILPAADRTFVDLCAGLGNGTVAAVGVSTIKGTFARTGMYSIRLAASDGVHPFVSGSFRVYVTPPEDRPGPVVRFNGSATLQGGRQGTFQGTCDQVGGASGQPLTCDQVTVPFHLPVNGLDLVLNLTYTGGPGAGTAAANLVQWTIYWGLSTVASGSGPLAAKTVVDDNAKLPPGDYRIVLKLDQGAQCALQLEGVAHLDLDPYKVY